MDASRFLTSKTFNRSLNFIPDLNRRSSKCLHKFASSPFNRRSSKCLHKFASSPFSSSITTCNVRSRLPEDDREPPLESDWRTFRARLVAGERASTAMETTTQSQNLSGRWVHRLHEPERGCLLIATEKLDGVHIFERTVVLLISTASLCYAGVILNRPSLMSIKEMKSTAFSMYGAFSDRPLFFGGPLEDGMFLVRSRKLGECGVFEEVMEGLYYGTKESVGCGAEMVKRNVVGVEDFRFFDGCCGWKKGQLEEEIKAGYWKVVACSLGVAEMSTAGLWEEVSGLVEKRNLW